MLITLLPSSGKYMYSYVLHLYAESYTDCLQEYVKEFLKQVD